MIVKPRTIPFIIQYLEALLRRTDANHPLRPKMKEDLAKRKAGYNGELTLDYYLNFLPKDDYLIFQDLRLKQDDYFFQIDTLIITPFFSLIIEVKNIAGKLHFDPVFNQLIRIMDDIEQGLPDPISQINRQANQLQKWMHSQQLPSLPLESLIVISQPSTIIDTPRENRKINQFICHAANVNDRIKKLNNFYTHRILNVKDLRKLKRLLLKSHTPQSTYGAYPASKSELITGVQCPSCERFSMQRKTRKWFCPACQTFNKDAHLQAVQDYFLLFGDTITNMQFREYLHIQSPDIAKRMLREMGLPFTGSNKGRVYHQQLKR